MKKKLFVIAAIGLSMTAAFSMVACGEKETGKKEINAKEYMNMARVGFTSYTENYQTYEKFGDMKLRWEHENKYTYMDSHSYYPEGSEDEEPVWIELESYDFMRMESTYEIKRIDGELFITIDTYKIQENSYYEDVSHSVMALNTLDETEIPSNFQKVIHKNENRSKITFGVENGVYYLKIDSEEKGENVDDGYSSTWGDKKKLYNVFEEREDYVREVEYILEIIDESVAGYPYRMFEDPNFLISNANLIAYSKVGDIYSMEMDVYIPYFYGGDLTMYVDRTKASLSFCEQGVDKMYTLIQAYNNEYEYMLNLEYKYASSLIPETNALKGYTLDSDLDAEYYLNELPE